MLLSGDGGWLNSRLKTVRESRRRLDRAALNQTKNPNQNDASMEVAQTEDIEDADADIEIDELKMMVVNDSTIEAIMTKLDLTRNYRQKMMKRGELNLEESFPFFFTHPKLVSRYFPIHIRMSFQTLILIDWYGVRTSIQRN